MILKHGLRTLALIILTAICTECQQIELEIRDTTVVDVRRGNLHPHHDVFIEGSRIVAIKKTSKRIPRNARVESTGGYVIPGLWDMHVHIAGVMAEPAWSADVLFPELLKNGITSVRDMGGDTKALARWRGEIEENTRLGPHLYFSGPMLTSSQSNSNDSRTVRTAEDARRAVAELKAEGVDFIKVLHMPRDAYFAVARASQDAQLDFVGHLPFGVSVAEAATAGQKSIEHINWSVLAIDCSAQPDAIRKELIGALQSGEKGGYSRVLDKAAANFDAANCASVAQAMVKHGTWSVPTLVSEEIGASLMTSQRDGRYLALLPENIRQEMSSEKLVQENPPERVEWLQRQWKNDLRIAALLHRHGVRMLAGSDSLDVMVFPGPTLHRELQLLVEIGLTPAEALRSATYDAAQFMHRDNSGTVEAGKLADLVLLNANPLADIRNTTKIASVILGGRVVFQGGRPLASPVKQE